MIPWHSYLLYVGLYAVAVAVPGPGVIAIVARALGSGFKSVIPGTLGILVGDLCLMTLSAFGLALVAQAMGQLFLAVKDGRDVGRISAQIDDLAPQEPDAPGARRSRSPRRPRSPACPACPSSPDALGAPHDKSPARPRSTG